MLLLYLTAFATLLTVGYSVTGSDSTWYRGCFHNTEEGLPTNVTDSHTDVATCTFHCLRQRFRFAAVQYEGTLQCVCLYGLDQQPGWNVTETDGCCDYSFHSTLPVGTRAHRWAVYATRGPYLTTVTIETDPSVLVDTPVAIEIFTRIAAPINVTKDDGQSGRIVDFHWWITGENVTRVQTVDLEDYTEYRLKRQWHTFTDNGTFRIEVEVNNGLSSLTAGLDLTVIYPSPSNLQVSIPDDLHINLPTCLPTTFKVAERSSLVLAVFVNTTLQMEASVSMGTNLTFTLWFEDNDESYVIQPCPNCTEVTQPHTFTMTGLYRVSAMASNSYGAIMKNISVVVIEPRLSDLTISIHPASSHIATTKETFMFTVSMETTSRSNLYLEVFYGDGHSNIVPIKDTNTSDLILQGDGKNMDIIANYGEGCRLIVEFKYQYTMEGFYNPMITVFRNSTATNETDDDFVTDMPSELTTELEHHVLVVKEVYGLRLEAPRVAQCRRAIMFTLHFVSRFNLTVFWTVSRVNDDDDMEVLDNITTSELRFVYKFDVAGAYKVAVYAVNARSAATVSANVVIQCPVSNLVASCSDEFIQTDEQFECIASVDHGTDVRFIWTFEGSTILRHIYYKNTTSIIQHRFLSAGVYDISVEAANNVSSEYVEIEESLVVQDPIRHITVYKDSRTLLGNMTNFGVMCAASTDDILDNFYCEFDIDYGEGRRPIHTAGCEGSVCYGPGEYTFPTVGRHNVTLYAYNRVSEVEDTVVIWVLPGLANVTVDVVGVAVVGSPTRFLIKQNGIVMATENVYFNWLFEGGETYCTNSPLVEWVFGRPGGSEVYLNITNPVVSEVFRVPVWVKKRSEVRVELLHDLYVAVGDDLVFRLKVNVEGPLIGWSRLLVNYSDGTSAAYDGVKYQWHHQFPVAGVQQVNITLLGAQGTSIEVMTSYIMVQEPIRGLYLDGPASFAYEKFRAHTWHAFMSSGTHVIYRWSLGGTVVTTAPDFEKSVSDVGYYTIRLEAYNDITPPIHVRLLFHVTHPPLDKASLGIFGGLVGEETTFQVNVTGYLEFFVNFDFGDDKHLEVYSLDPRSSMNFLNIKKDIHTIYVTHVYSDPGVYTITVNVSNNESSLVRSEIFIPLVNVTLTTSSPWVIQTLGHVTVTAVAEGGQDLEFFWEFSDYFEETLVKRFPNMTSKAMHSFGMSGEYLVYVNVTGLHYPPPGVSVCLPRNFTVVDPIEAVNIATDHNYAPLIGATTDYVTFKAESTGSHATFLFHFGDGVAEEVLGTQLPYISLDLTMSAEVQHRYTAVGVYTVKVTAVNPLGNKTVVMSRPFYVQQPPENLKLSVRPRFNVALNSYATKVGEPLAFHASVTSGTNVTFDWKMGDQTDIVMTGPAVSHQYHTPGERTVFVTARNKVKRLEKSARIYVNHEIQGVQIIAATQLVSVGQSVLYEAIARPTYPHLVNSYVWRFKSPTRSRSRTPGHQRYVTRHNRIQHTFTTSGWCTATVYAQNAISNATSMSIDIHVIAKIEKLKIGVMGNKLVNKPIRFQYFVYEGSDLNLTWSFGDDTPNVVTTDREVKHVFTREAGYNITLTASNPVSSEAVSQMLFVLERSYCDQPEVAIISRPGLQVYHSRQFTLEADVLINCNITSIVTYDWSVDGNTAISLAEAGQVMNRRVLVLPPRTLPIGNYSLTFKATMTNTIVYSVDTTHLEVISSPLVSHIEGGVFRRVNQNGMILLDGSGSHDPDWPGNRNLSYQWSCRYTDIDGNSGSDCFIASITHDPLDTVAMTTPRLYFPANYLTSAANFTFELTLFAAGRINNTAFQVIEVYELDTRILDLRIVCHRCSPDLINTNRKLSFYSECPDCPSEGLQFEWSLLRAGQADPFNPARAHDNRCIEPDGSSYQAYRLAALNDTTGVDNTTLDEDTDLEDMDDYDEDYEDDYSDITMEPYIQTDPFLDNRIETDIEHPDTGWEPEDEMGHKEEPMLPWIIAEGTANDGVNRRKRFAITNGTSLFEIPVVQEDKDAGNRMTNMRGHEPYISEKFERISSRRRPPPYDNDITNQMPMEFTPQEGKPGESGSSGGRNYDKYGLPKVTEHMGGVRQTDNYQGDDGYSSGYGGKDSAHRLRQPGENQHDTILDQPMTNVRLRASHTKTGIHGTSLVIKPDVLQQGRTYVLQLKVTRNDEVVGQAKTSFSVNESPVYGKCSIRQEEGIEMETEFNMHCTDWKDVHLPLMYEVSYSVRRKDGEPKILIYRGLDNEFAFRLPAGDPDNDFKVQLYIYILDGLLAKTSVCSIELRVTPRTFLRFGDTRGPTDSQIIHDEVTSLNGALQKSINQGNDAVSKVYIGYLAVWLNNVANSTSTATYVLDKSANATYVINNKEQTEDKAEKFHGLGVVTKQQGDGVEERQAQDKQYRVDTRTRLLAQDKQYRVDTRTRLLEILQGLPVRDEAEVLQSAQALSYATSSTDELSQTSLDHALEILKSVSRAAQSVYHDDLSPAADLIPLAVKSASSIIMATADVAKHTDRALETAYKQMITESVHAVEQIVQIDLQFHVASEPPIESTTDFFSIRASQQNTAIDKYVQIDQTKFVLPKNLETILKDNLQAQNQSGELTNGSCFRSHMTTFKRNPFSFGEHDQVESTVGSLSLYGCDGRQLPINNLTDDQQLQVELPNLPSKVHTLTRQILQKWAMNTHQFNVTRRNLRHALHLVVDLTAVKGRLFPISILISYQKPPSPDFYLKKFNFEARQTILELFFPANSFNVSGVYYIGIVDATYNSDRLRTGEVTQRIYKLKLWWGECLFWHLENEAWSPDGCHISQESTFHVTKCLCNHLTTFGGHFELIPNELTIVDVENFFRPNKNHAATSVIGCILFLYVLLFIICRHADKHDAKKGGIVYLLDNTPVDKQKYEITVETGLKKGAGTSAKISIILHGEEGMSETRELISEDDRPMFERNSRDKFILTLPDSIGRILKVQLWHNNFGDSPSWYLCRVIVRDLNTGVRYYFICEKWLAVEEQDGKVEREFMALDSPLTLEKVFRSKGMEYFADFHIWTSLVMRPAHSGFIRIERLTVCLAMLMMYMCLNAMWYQRMETEYRGEFGLLDLSWYNVVVGAICCGVVIPFSLLLELLFRRSKPEHASSCMSRDEASEWDRDYPSGKPSEDTSEHVPPVMTYSLIDQSILNWPNIQHWAQKQWMKRQQSVGSTSDNHSGHSMTSNHNVGSSAKPATNNVMGNVLLRGGLELDQASSGFEDCCSVIRPKASVDSMHTTAAPSVAESMRTHKPPSPTESKPPSMIGRVNKSKAPSISSTSTNKSAGLIEKKVSVLSRLYLPFWCRYLSWSLCIVICAVCGAITVMYSYRFGVTKTNMWLQSLYFSFMVCVFITQPALILLAVLHTVVQYGNDPAVFNHYDIFNREKAKTDMKRWKRQIEKQTEALGALERGVAARQRSRYLRFARPPQEKQLLEARRKVVKEKKAMAVFRDMMAFIITVIPLLLMAYGKDTSLHYHVNHAAKTRFAVTGSPCFTAIASRDEWYSWTKTSLLDIVYSSVNSTEQQNVLVSDNSYIIGQVQLRQQRIQQSPCPQHLPHTTLTCIGPGDPDTGPFGQGHGWTYTAGEWGNFVYGNHGVYDGSGYTTALNNSRTEALQQLQWLESANWLDRHTRAVFVEFTMFNTPTNLFTSVNLLLEMSPVGSTYPYVQVMSTQLFRYITGWDNFVLACELLYFVVMMYRVKCETTKVIQHRRKYFHNLWNVLEFLTCLISTSFCLCFVSRFFFVSHTVESLRSSYYEQYVDVSFTAFWDDVLRSAVAVLLFLSFVKSLRLLRYNKQFAVIGDVYRRASRELILFVALFIILLLAYTSLGYLMFSSLSYVFRDVGSSIMAVTAMLTQNFTTNDHQQSATAIFIFAFCIFAIGLLLSYIIAVLSYYFKSRRKRRLLAMGIQEAITFYWQHLQLWTGWKRTELEPEPEVILPPEFTMAEIEYQVEELLFRMNALTGSHGLPEKQPCYFTDSDCTYGGGDDGISSGGSEAGQPYGDDRLEQRVQRIEDNLCSQEPFLAQLLQLDSVGADNFSQVKEKQLRSHLELEIFRQLQIQRQEVQPDHRGGQDEEVQPDHRGGQDEEVQPDHRGGQDEEVQPDHRGGQDEEVQPDHRGGQDEEVQPDHRGGQDEEVQPDHRGGQDEEVQPDHRGGQDDKAPALLATPNSPGHDSIQSSSSDDVHPHSTSSSSSHSTPSNIAKLTKPKKPRASLTIHDFITKSTHETKDSRNDNSSSNPDSPRDKLTFIGSKKPGERGAKNYPKTQNLSDISNEKISPDFTKSRKPAESVSENPEHLKPTRNELPVKPTFLQSREHICEGVRGSPIMKLHRQEGHVPDRITESSSGSEQDGIHCARKAAGKRSLRKTKSRGKGKGPDSLEPELILDELDCEDGEGVMFEELGDGARIEELDIENGQQLQHSVKYEKVEHTVSADVHHSNN